MPPSETQRPSIFNTIKAGSAPNSLAASQEDAGYSLTTIHCCRPSYLALGRYSVAHEPDCSVADIVVEKPGARCTLATSSTSAETTWKLSDPAPSCRLQWPVGACVSLAPFGAYAAESPGSRRNAADTFDRIALPPILYLETMPWWRESAVVAVAFTIWLSSR